MKWLLVVVLFVAGCGGSAGSSAPAAADTAPVTAAAAATPQVLLDIQGSGSKSSQTFSAKRDWDLTWTYDCSSAFGGKGNFVVDVFNAADNSQNFTNQGINQLGAKDSGVEHYHSGGTFYLEVLVGCNWTLRATG